MLNSHIVSYLLIVSQLLDRLPRNRNGSLWEVIICLSSTRPHLIFSLDPLAHS